MARFFIGLRKSLAIATTSAFILPLALPLAPAHAGAEDAWKCPDSNSMCWTETFPKNKVQKYKKQRNQLHQRQGQRAKSFKGQHYQPQGRSIPVWKVQPQRDMRHLQKRRNKNGEWVAAGVIGLAIGAIVANEAAKKQHTYAPQIAQPQYQPQITTDFPPAPRSVSNRNNNNVVTLESAFQPWSQGWYEWCDDRYRSFNPNTGTYRGYDGLNHFCVVK